MYRNREPTTGFIDECAAGFEWIVLCPRGDDGRWLVESRHREQPNAEKWFATTSTLQTFNRSESYWHR